MREQWEGFEAEYLQPWAAKSVDSAGRQREEQHCPLRTCWQRDRDRIIHSKAFRRLMHKTQVFVAPGNDHFRTRLTHTLEVSQIARTISRALGLNEDLTEAVALGHDLGHTPFGHAGERALARVYPGFTHYEQSLRVVDLVEHEGAGLNLTLEVRDGLLHHSGPELPATLEGRVVRLCDRIAYLNHDIDDALRSGYLHEGQIPPRLTDYLGPTHSKRINTMVQNVVSHSLGQPMAQMDAECSQVMDELREFMFRTVYLHPRKVAEEDRLGRRLINLYGYYLAHEDELPDEYRRAPHDRAVCDYIAGMTDNFALDALARLGM